MSTLKKVNYKASVLIANYNNQKYLVDCIDSILNQSYKNIEIIVLDDSSNDNSFEILKRYKDKIILLKKKNSKTNIASYDQTESYHECLKIASGEIIFLCDSDDFFAEKKIENIIKKFEDNNESKIIFDLPIYKYDNNIVYKKLKKKFYKSFWPNIFPTSCISIKREDFVNNFAYLSCQEFPDIWLDFRLIVLSEYKYKDNTVYLNENLTYYRQTKTSISSKFKFLSEIWWKRRYQAHDYIKFFFKRNKIRFKPNTDYIVTKLINRFFK
tara:strand:- start:5787 stop:6593 length:807 start_codon:yes stop_codon:yes gene_type:complete